MTTESNDHLLYPDSTSHVNVPDTMPNTANLDEIASVIDPMKDSKAYGIDIFLEVHKCFNLTSISLLRVINNH
jgi:hypothetical protein